MNFVAELSLYPCEKWSFLKICFAEGLRLNLRENQLSSFPSSSDAVSHSFLFSCFGAEIYSLVVVSHTDDCDIKSHTSDARKCFHDKTITAICGMILFWNNSPSSSLWRLNEWSLSDSGNPRLPVLIFIMVTHFGAWAVKAFPNININFPLENMWDSGSESLSSYLVVVMITGSYSNINSLELFLKHQTYQSIIMLPWTGKLDKFQGDWMHLFSGWVLIFSALSLV